MPVCLKYEEPVAKAESGTSSDVLAIQKRKSFSTLQRLFDSSERNLGTETSLPQSLWFKYLLYILPPILNAKMQQAKATTANAPKERCHLAMQKNNTRHT
jgi:hypothetical protein